jgi:hypothetical protein
MGVTGYNELSALGFRLRQAKDVELTKELRKGLTDATKPLAKSIRERSPTYTPKGYEVTFATSLRFRTKIETGGASAAVDFVVTARGKTQSRQIKEINRGRLKHPVYGRSRYTRHGWVKNPWAWQTVKPGFFDDPVRDSFDAVRAEIQQAMRRVAEKITRG